MTSRNDSDNQTVAPGLDPDTAADRPELSASEAKLRISGLTTQTLYERIASHVRELIESEELRPGERLPTERELARILGVSRMPIREAIRTLSAQGLVEVRRGRGVFVASRGFEATVDELTAVLLKQRDTFRELFAVRRLLEPSSAQWAATQGDSEEIAKIGRIVDDMQTASERDPPDFETIGERDAQLHVKIAASSGNRVLIRIMQAIQDLHREQLETSLRYRGRLKATIRDHRRIVTAIANREPAEAYAAMVDHLANSERATMGRIEGEEPQPQERAEDER